MEQQQESLVKSLCELIQLDIDAAYAYGHAIDKIETSDVREHLVGFQKDHIRHVEELSAAVRRIGGEPPQYKRDFKGFVIEGFTAVMSSVGPEGALRAMKSNERMTNKTYRNAMGLAVPSDIYDIIRRNRDDEVRHLAYIERCLREKLYEAGQQAA